MNYKKILEEMLKPQKVTTATEDRIMAALDEMGLEYVFNFSGVGGVCCFCGKGECDFSVSGKSFHAECVAAKD